MRARASVALRWFLSGERHPHDDAISGALPLFGFARIEEFAARDVSSLLPATAG
ncbi:MAG: hypothetical protein ACLFNX_05100 [Spirochaetaceae bacterium]